MKLTPSILLILFILFGVLKADDIVTSKPATFIDDMEKLKPLAKDGDREYRAVLPNKEACFSIRKWWGSGSRPPEGTIFVLEIDYKDTVSTPAIVKSFSGLGRYLAPTEVHRFGGKKSEEWKKIMVPVSWDLIILKEGSDQAFFFVKNTDKENDLFISNVKVRDLVDGDEVRYNHETREWLSSELKKYADKIREVPYKDPEGLASDSKEPLIAFRHIYTEKINRNWVPDKSSINEKVYIRLALNELEPGCFGVFAREDLSNVTYSLSELKGSAGVLNAEVRLKTLQFSAMMSTDKKTKKENYYFSPENLWPVYPDQIKKGQSGFYWIIVKSDIEKTKAGTYEGKILISSDQGKVELPIKIEVMPITLLTMEEAGLHMGGCITGMPSQQEMKTMLEYNHNMVNLWFAGAQPGLKKEGDKVVGDYYYLDRWMSDAIKFGQKRIVWFLGGNPYGYPQTLSIERDLYRAAFGKSSDDFAIEMNEKSRGKVLPSVRPIYIDFLQSWLKHAKDKKWPELILTPFDEPAKWVQDRKADGYKHAIGTGVWIRDHFKDASALIHEAVPDVKVYVSMHHNKVVKKDGFNGRIGEIFIPDSDVVNTNAIDEDEDLGKKTMKKGAEFWQYSQWRGGRYNFGFYFQAYNSIGSLAWAYNWGERFNAYGKKEAQYAYNSPFGTIVTPEYELLREGWDDRRYYHTLKKMATDKGLDLSDFFAEIRKDTMENFGASTTDKVDDFFVDEVSKNKMDLIRAKIANQILKLK